MSKNLIDYYDEEKWGERILTKDELFDRERKSLALINSIKLKNNAKFLDVGCGVGFFMDQLHQQYPSMELYGVDYSKYNLKQARRLPYEFKQCDIEEGIPYKDKYFDFIYSAELIEHLVNPDYFLSECNRLLKKGGYLIVTTPNLSAWYNRVLMFLGMQPMFYEFSTKSPAIGSGILKYIKQGVIPVGHIRVFTIRAMKDLLINEGFGVLKVKGAHFAALPRPIRIVDNLFRAYPRLSSGMVVIARKK